MAYDIKCYLCGTPAKELMPDNSLDVIVGCKYCANRYKIKTKILRYFFEKEGKLNDDDKERLSRWVYDHFVEITPEVIKDVTGKESADYR